MISHKRRIIPHRRIHDFYPKRKMERLFQIASEKLIEEIAEKYRGEKVLLIPVPAGGNDVLYYAQDIIENNNNIGYEYYYNIEELEKNIEKIGKSSYEKIIVIDDVFTSGERIEKWVNALKKSNKDIKIATIFLNNYKNSLQKYRELGGIDIKLKEECTPLPIIIDLPLIGILPKMIDLLFKEISSKHLKLKNIEEYFIDSIFPFHYKIQEAFYIKIDTNIRELSKIKTVLERKLNYQTTTKSDYYTASFNSPQFRILMRYRERREEVYIHSEPDYSAKCSIIYYPDEKEKIAILFEILGVDILKTKTPPALFEGKDGKSYIDCSKCKYGKRRYLYEQDEIRELFNIGKGTIEEENERLKALCSLCYSLSSLEKVVKEIREKFRDEKIQCERLEIEWIHYPSRDEKYKLDPLLILYNFKRLNEWLRDFLLPNGW